MNKHKIKIIDLSENFFYPNGLLDWTALLEQMEVENASILDFSGFDRATDLLFWLLQFNLPANQSFKLGVDKFLLNGCSCISIWTIHYLFKNFGLSFFNDHTSRLDEKLMCCPRISESLMVSLSYDFKNFSKDRSVYNQAKCIIINSDSFSPKIVEALTQYDQNNEANNSYFTAVQLQDETNQILNIYQCSQSFCSIFLTERNFVVLTYDLTDKEESLKYSVLSRLLQVLGTNILPIGILIVGLGEYNEKVTEYIEKRIVHSLNKIQKFLNKLVDSQIKNIQNPNFNLQLELSELVNLSEKIGLILEIIDYGVIPNNKTFDELLIIKPKLVDNATNTKCHLDEIQKISNRIDENDLAELKSFKAPPSVVQNVAEAMCYLFAKQASYQNFVKLLNTNNFLDQLRNFDLNLINDYKLKNLEKYIQMPAFDCDTIANFSRPASVLCDWIHSVYNYGSAAGNEEKSTASTISNTNLTDYLFDKSFFMFKWNLYYGDKYESSEKEIDELITKSINLKNKPILTIDELNQLFLANEKLKEYQSNQFKQLSLRYARAQSARGRFFYNEKNEFIITDLIWLKSVFDILSNRETNESHLNDILGTDIPVWNKDELREQLEKLCPTDQIFDYLISFLKENSLIIVTDKEEIIPIFCLSKNEDSAFDEWSDKWSDLEYKISWELFSPLPFNVFSEFVSMFFDSRTCLNLCKNGFLYQDTHFDALVRYSEKEVYLSVRMLDPERYFNLTDKSFLNHFKTIYMNFYIYLKYLIFKSHSIYLLKLDSQCFKHPICDDKEVKEYERVWSSDLSFLQNLFEISQHNFEKNEKDESKCNVCDLKFYKFKKLKNAYFELFMKFFEVPLSRVSKKRPNHFLDGNNDQLYCYLPEIHSINENYSVFILDFTSENMVQDFFICLSTDNAENSEIWIFLQKMEIKFVKTKSISVTYSLLSEKSDLKNQINMGDVVKIEFLKEKKSVTRIKLCLNGLSLLEIESIDCNLVPHFGSFRDTFDVKSEYRKNLKKNSYLKIQYFKTQLNCLIDHYLEARDRKKSNIFTTAKIIHVKENSVLVHLTRANCDYWADISDLDLRPAGWYNYTKKKREKNELFNQLENKNIKFYSFMNSNKLNHEFEWSEFLKKNSYKAVPFDLFTIEQKSGMDLSEFKGNNDDIAQRPCLKNSKKYLQYINDYMKQKSVYMIEKQVKMKYDQISAPLRGILLLPQKFKDLIKPKKYSLLDDLKLHMCCMTRLNDDKTLYAHLLNVKGISIKKEMINMNDLTVILISSYLVYNSKFDSIVPDNCQIFDDKDTNIDEHELTKHIRDYLKYLFEELSIFLNLSQMESQIFTIDLKKYHSVAIGKQESTIYKFEKSPIPLGRCYYCFLADYKYSHSSRQEYSLNEKINEYSKFCLHFGIVASDRILNLEAKFAKNFPNLVELILISVPLEIDDQNFFLHLENLIYLKLWNNNLDSIPKSIFKLEKLKSFSFVNRIDADCLKFDKMKSLETLELENLEVKDPQHKVRLPGAIKNLKISRSSFSHFIFKLKPLKTINLKFIGIALFDLKKCLKNSSLIGEESYTREISKTKLLSSDQSKKLFKYFDSNSNGYLESDEILKLNAFLFKRFLRLGPDLPNIILQMTYLETLDLSFQSIEQISDEIENLKNLYSLILNNCILLQSISPKLANLSLIKLSLSNCLSLVTPPPEIVDRGMDSVMTYLKKLISGSVELKRTKLMLVGLGQAGKTSLSRALKGFKKEKCDVTDGISIDDWHVDLDDGSQLSFSMWDFAGQSVYYNTHQFFLSSRSVYLLVWNVRLGSEYAGLEFWLSSISCHSPSAPVLIVGTHIDQVSKYTLNQKNLKSRFKNIVGFYFVSCTTRYGIDQLRKEIVDITLKEKYIGEKIPKAWIDFENSIKVNASKKPLILYEDIKLLAEKNGIYEERELEQSIRFLHDLGSVQFFENQILRNRLVINPQWIVDAFAKIVSVKETSIQDGKFTIDELKEVWSDYEENLHEWMLKLTEEFDLTFSLQDNKTSIIPCLLPETEPEFEWPEIDHKSSIKIKHFRVMYTFDYLPIGLFNRIQVRLYQYGDNSVIWKKGSLLKKKSHLAMITQLDNLPHIQVIVQGIKPENIILVIHEAIETLINDSFDGLKYDFSFPCPDCVDSQSIDPHLFSSVLLKRASELKAPFLQCAKHFHAVSIEEMMAIMPIDESNNMDLNLEYSIRDLKKLRDNFKFDIMFWYCEQDTVLDQQKSIDPLNVIKAIEFQGYKIWYSNTPSREKFDKITSIIKQSKLVIFGVSDNFSRDSKSIQIFELAKNLIKKTYLLIEFGLLGARKWLLNPIFASSCADFRIIMQDPKRYATKIADTLESIEKIVQVDPKKERGIKKPDVFISYCWANSHEAIKKGSKGTNKSLGWLDPRSLVKFFADNGINAWLDIDNLDSTTQMFGEITRGMNLAKVIVACVSDEYVESQNCKLEFRFAHISLKLPIIKAVVGLGNEWRKNEIAFLAGNYSEINFQYETSEAFPLLLNYVKQELNNIQEKCTNNDSEDQIFAEDSNINAYNELYELTQRKFLRQLIQFSDAASTIRSYPRLFFLDLIDEDKIQNFKYKKQSEVEKEDYEEKLSMDLEEMSDSKKFFVCIRPMCEHDECWHFSDFFVSYPNVLASNCVYLLRIMTILMNCSFSSEFGVLISEKSENLLKEIKEKEAENSTNIKDSYNSLRSYFIEKYENDDFYYSKELSGNQNESFFGLNKYELKNGKILWLCAEHSKAAGGKMIRDQKKSGYNQNREKNRLFEQMSKVNDNII